MLSFFDLPERPNSFRLPLSRVFSFTLRVRLATGSPVETGPQSDDKGATFLFLILEDSEFFFTDFLFICPDLEEGFALGLGKGGGGAGGGVSSNEG